MKPILDPQLSLGLLIGLLGGILGNLWVSSIYNSNVEAFIVGSIFLIVIVALLVILSDQKFKITKRY